MHSTSALRVVEFVALVFVPVLVAMALLRMQFAALKWTAAGALLTGLVGVGTVAAGESTLRAYLTGIRLLTAPVLCGVAGAVVGSGVVRGRPRVLLAALPVAAALTGHILAPTGLPSWVGGSLSGAPLGVAILALAPFAIGFLAGRTLRERVVSAAVVLAVGGVMTVIGQTSLLHIVS